MTTATDSYSPAALALATVWPLDKWQIAYDAKGGTAQWPRFANWCIEYGISPAEVLRVNEHLAAQREALSPLERRCHAAWLAHNRRSRA